MNPIDLNDPRLTLYALREMEPREQAEFEKLLAADPAARQAVEEIRAMAETVAGALEHEPIEASPPAKRGVLLRFPQLYYMVSGLAAACFAMFFVYWQRNQGMEHKQYMEVPLTAPAVAAADGAKKAEADSAANERLLAAGKEGYKLEQEARTHQKVAVNLPAAASVAVEAQELVALDKSQMVADGRNAPSANAMSYAPTGAAVAQGKDYKADAEKRDAVINEASARANRREQEAKNAVAMQLPVASAPAPAPAAVGAASADEMVLLDKFEVAAKVATPSFRGAGAGYRAEQMAKRQRLSGVVSGFVETGRVDANTEAYSFRKDNDYLRVADQPLSTFSIDVDTASYANVRRFLQQGQRPPADAVRIEELVNYFPYHYAPPVGNVPFAVALESASAPWNPAHRLVRIGLKGRDVTDSQRPPANLVFLLDVSGSMNEANKLPLVKQSLRLLVNKLRADDRVAIAVYAGASGMALPSTSATHKAEILDAIDRLEASGSTNGAMGIQLAYDLAKANFVPGGVNRVILATDGDFNVGVTSEGGLVRLVQEKAKSGVFLSVLGFGMGNIKDSTLEQLADKGNGNYAYIDSLAEARKALVEQAGGTLMTIAKDVKIQVEFNPLEVAAYRLIGYENRVLAKEDFNNDKVDAGDIGAGHTVTALYEVVPVGAELPATGKVDALKYQVPAGPVLINRAEMLTVKIRYKEPAGDVSSKLEFPLRDGGAAFASASPDFKFAAAVAAFGMVLRDSPHKGASTLTDVAAWAREGIEDDAGGYRAEFITLVERAATLQ